MDQGQITIVAVSSFAGGFRAFFDGLSLIRKHSLWGYIILPSLIGLITYIAMMVVVYGFLQDVLLTAFGGSSTIGEGFWYYLISITAFFASITLVFLTYRLVAGIIVIPFLGPLLSRVERIITGNSIGTTFMQDFRNALLGTYVGIRFSAAGILIWFFSLILGPLQLPVVAFAESYFLGRQAMDYVFEKETRNLKERSLAARTRLPAIMGLGFAFFIFLWIPLIGVFMGHPAAIAGAAIIRHR